MTNTMMIFTIVVYMAVMVYIGVRCSKQNRSSDDFYLGGRRLGPFVTAMSAEASDMSSWLLMGLPGVALLSGIADAFWTALGLAVGTYLNWLIVARRIRKYSEKNASSTIPEFFSNRFRDGSGILLALSAVTIVVFFVPYTASGFAAVGKLFNTLFGIEYHTVMIAGAAVIVAYTAIGGFLAASTTDFLQSIIMSIALFVVVLFGIEHAGGFSNIADAVRELPGYLSLTQKYNGTATPDSYGFLTIVSTMAWGLGYFGMPHILLRFMAIEDDRKLTLSRRVASVWVVISMGIAILIGVIGYSFASNTGLLAEGFDAERIIIEMAKTIASLDTFAAVLAGLILSGILASIMSTADSQMLAAASSVSENIVHRFLWKKMPSSIQMLIARITVCAVAVIAVIFAWDPDSSVFGIVSFAWAGFGAAFGPLMLFALFWKRTNRWGALAGMLVGGAGVVLWEYVITPLGVRTGIAALTIYELLPAFLLSSVAIAVVSLLTAPPCEEVVKEFEEVAAEMKAAS